MKFTANKEQIINELQSLAAVADKKQTLPILSNILVKCEGSTVKLQSTDLEVELEVEIFDVNVERPGEITIPAKKTADIVRELPDGDVSFELDEGSSKLTVKSKSGRYSLSTIPGADFPEFDSVKSENIFSIKSSQLLELFQKTSFAMANQDWRHYLNGLYITVEDTSITSVATDAHRLAMSTLGINEAAPEIITGIVPRKSINEIGKLVGDSSENILLQIGSSSINVDISGTTFSSKLIEGKFPDYQQVIPSGDSSTLTINKKSLSESLSRVSVLSSEKFRGIRIITSENSINISANNPEKEQAEESVDCSYKGEPMDIAFNVNYLQEILSSIDESNVDIHFFGSDKSCLITNPGSDSYKYVVMPLLI